eukprot:TRINITY_DN14027_c0_g1_i1.p1 TRINITY_DN14027_c0_g1~~TRINITY_DN14027_c0_g1_i1.p1  ORF type:complete len:3041 (+),score=553.21 TRINITY_DN14027_c0_g1_i1:116-9238(+)
MGGQPYTQEQKDALTQLKNYMPIVANDIAKGELSEMSRHARRLLHLMQFVSDPGLMEKVIEQVTEVGVAQPTALAEGWIGFIDYLITWYISPKASRTTVRTLDFCISRLSANFKLMAEHSAGLIVRLCESLTSVAHDVSEQPTQPRRELYISKQHTYSSSVVFPDFVYQDILVGHKDADGSQPDHSDLGTNCNNQLQLATRILAAIVVVQHAIGNAVRDHLQITIPRLIPALTQSTPLLAASSEFCTLSLSCAHYSYVQIRNNPSNIAAHSNLISEYCCAVISSNPTLLKAATTELQQILKGLFEADSNTVFSSINKRLFDGIEVLIRSIPVHDKVSLEQYKQVMISGIRALYRHQSPQNLIVSDTVKRLVSLSGSVKRFQSGHIRLMSFYIGILVSVLSTGGDNCSSKLYFELLACVPMWACIVPATGTSGVQFLKAMALKKWESPPPNPLSHAVQVIEGVTLVSKERQKLSSGDFKLDINTELKIYEMMWIKISVIVAAQAGTASGQILTEGLWKLIEQCLVDERSQVRHEALLCIEAVLAISSRVGLGIHSDECSQMVRDLCSDVDVAVKTLAFEVFCKLSDYFPKTSSRSISNPSTSPDSTLAIQPLRPRQFSLLVQTLAGSTNVPDEHNEGNLRRIVAELFTLSRSLNQQPKNSEDMKAFVSSSAVRYCIAEKLKTSLGNPAQTFEALEKLLKSIGARSLMIEDNYSVMSQAGSQLLRSEGSQGKWHYEERLSPQLVLLVVNELEKWIHLVQEGYTFETERRQPPWSNLSTMFFHTNKKVCNDYYSRIRIQQVAAGDAVSSPGLDSMFVRSCHFRLLEMLQFVSSPGIQKDVKIRVFFEMEKVVLSNCSVHVRRHQDSEIYGLMKWAEMLVQRHIPEQQVCGNLLWKAMLGMTLHASARYEEALKYYDSVFTDGAIHHCQLTFLRIISYHFVDCCTRSMQWGEFDRWIRGLRSSASKLQKGDRKLQFIKDEILAFHDNLPGVGCTSTALGLEYACALGEWESGRPDRCSSIITRCDNRVSVLLSNSSRNSFHHFVPSIPPELIARIRIMRLLVESTEARQQLQRTSAICMQLLQNNMVPEATEEGLMLGRILSLLQVNGDVTKQSRKFCEAALLLGHKIDRSGLFAAASNELQWSREYCASLCQAAETARGNGNRALASKYLSRLLSESRRDRYLREWAERGAYEVNLLHADSSDPKEVRQGIQSLAKAGEDGGLTACKSLLKLHQISENEDTMPAVADTMKVHASQVTSLIMRTLIEKCSTKKEAVSKYAEWCAKTAGSGTRSEAFWSQAITAHINALALPTTKDDEPLIDMKLALRVLKLLLRGVSAGFVIDEKTVAEIAKTPIRVWQNIIPQLMAHLTSSTPAMHSAVKQALLRIGSEPLLLLYPLVAALGTSTGSSKLVFQELWSSAAVDDAAAIFSTTKEFVSELVRITELLDEETASVVGGLTQSLSKTLPVYKNFVKSKLSSGNSAKFNLLKKQKFEALLQPLVQVLEKHIEKLQKEPSCLHENEFQSEALPKLKKLLHELKYRGIASIDENVSVDTAVEEAHAYLLSLFSSLYKNLNDTERRPHILSLPDVSPKLARLANTEIPVPGTMDSATIVSLEMPIEIVPSKTRPKKLQLWGSDGSRYTFLLKGKEDLSLDERVMQVLKTITVLLGASKAGRQKGLSARSYAVVPLSDRSGIIRFVENVQPIFHIHRQWMKRKVYLDCMQKNKKPQKSSFRPVHHFFTSLLPALKEVGISNVGTREDWPADVLTRVFNQLAAEVPKDLLSKELWCRGLSPLSRAPSECGTSGWLRRVKTYSSSLAVMSVVGYIIGLGDRHLDNILMDLDSGEIVHIDYNICFEKGLQLRVPEVVPFRLTPVLQDALGIQGVGGTFSHVCEDTLSVLRSSKDVLLDLLEAFVHDPLVEWTAKRICDPATDGLEVKVSLGVLGTHLDEILPELSDTWSKCSSAMIVLANAVEELRASRYTEVVTTIREKKQAAAHITIDISEVQQELSDIQSGKLTKEDLASAYDDFNAARSDLQDKHQQFAKIQHDCEEAHSIVSANRSLLVLPTDPTQDGDMNVALRLSEESDRAEWCEQSQGAVLQLQNQELRLPSCVNNHRQQASLLADHLAKWADAIEGLEIANTSHNLVYSELNYCNIWVTTYKKLLQADEAFTQDGSLQNSSYEEYNSAADKQLQELAQLSEATSTQLQYQKQIAPYQLFGGTLEKTQELATDLMSAFFPLQKELEIMESKHDVVSIDSHVEVLTAAVAACAQPKLLILHAASIVLNDTEIDIRAVLALTSSKKVHSWEKSMSLPEMEELDDPMLFLHSKWNCFNLFKKSVLVSEFIAEWILPSMSQLKGTVKDKLESCQVLHTAITAVEKLLKDFSGNLFTEIGKAFVTLDSSVMTEFDHYVQTGSCGTTGDYSMGVVLIEAIESLIQEYETTVVRVLDYFPHTDNSKVSFIASERAEAVRQLASEVLQYLREGYPSLFRKHMLHRRCLGILRTMLSSVLEIALLDVAGAELSELLGVVVKELALHGSTVAGKLHPSKIRPQYAGLKAQLQDLIDGVCEKLAIPQLSSQLHHGASALLSCASAILNQRSQAFSHTLKSQFRATGYYQELRIDIKVAVLNYKWLLEPVLKLPPLHQNSASGTDAVLMVAASDRKQLIDDIESQYLQYRNSIDDLKSRIAQMHITENSIPDSLLNPEIKQLIASRKKGFADALAHYDQLCQFAKRLVFLEVLRNLSTQNEVVHRRLIADCERSLTHLTTLTRTVVAVSHRKERTADLRKKLRALQQKEGNLKKEVITLRETLNVLQRKSSAATSGAYAEVIGNKTKYLQLLKHIDSLLTGVVKTLSQFPALRRLHQRVKCLSEAVGKVSKQFRMWCLVFDRVLGPEAAVCDDVKEQIEFKEENSIEGVNYLDTTHSDIITQLEDLSLLASGDDPLDVDEDDNEVQEEGETQQNHHALNIIRRVELKLDGKDNGNIRSRTKLQQATVNHSSDVSNVSPTHDSSIVATPLLVSEQVARIISEAVSPTNLIHMYEGWTAWI